MENHREKIYISDLLYKKITGLASEAELSVVDNWMKADKRNVQLYNNILDKEGLERDFNTLNEVETQKLWNKLNIKKQVSKSILPQLMRWAAVFIILGGITTLFLLDFNKSLDISKEGQISKVVPGSNKATLIVDGGKVITLEESQKAVVSNTNEISITDSDSTGLKYTSCGKVEIPVQIHTLDIPVGGEYSVKLSDGTQVWLNSKSKLKYPTDFKGNLRVVDLLEGEAYFKVAKNRSMPFFVRARNTVVRVTGTSFVVSAYKDDEYITTSLVEGSVDVSFKDKKNKVIDRVSLVPGMKAIIKEDSIETRKVNVLKEIAWLQGRFVFESERLDEILKRMSRWYDLDIFYQNPEVKDIVFTLDIRKYETVETFLNAIEKIGDVRFRMKNRTLIVTNK